MQSKRHSLEETVVSTAVGFGASMLINEFVLPIVLGIEVNMGQNLLIVAVFTVASIARGYLIRRFYNRQTQKSLHI